MSENMDFEIEAVPFDKRKSFWSITSVWTGYVFIVTSMMAGGGLSTILPLNKIILATFLGNIFLSIIAVGMSIIAYRTGLTFALMTRHSFGNYGSKVTSSFLPITNIGWYAVNSAVYGSMISQVFNLNSTGELLAMIISAIVMGLVALVGFDALNRLSLVAIPAIIFLCIATSIRGIMMFDGTISQLLVKAPQAEGSIASGLILVIGTWIFSASSGIADIMRYASSVKDAILSVICSLVLGNSLLILCGAVSAISVGESDLPSLLISMGLYIPGLILLTTNIFTTNGTNLYSNGLSVANVFRHAKRSTVFLVLISIGAFLTIFRPQKLSVFFIILNTMSMIMPSLPGIIFVDFFIFNKGKYPKLEETNKICVKWLAILSWIIAIILTYTVKIGFPPLNGIIFGATIYFILTKFFSNKYMSIKNAS